MSDGTSVWAQLASSQMIQYGVPYIDPNELVPAIDTGASGLVLNFGYKPNAPGSSFAGVGVLSVGTFGDLTGTDPISSGGQVDSYVPQSLINAAVVGQYSAFTVSSSRGSRAIPSVIQGGDLIGEFGGYGYVLNVATGVYSYQLLGAMQVIAQGGDANFPGGFLQWGTRINAAGAMNYTMKLDDAGNFSLYGKLYPPNLVLNGGFQTAAAIYVVTGVPSNTLGTNGDFALRSDGANTTCIYQKRAGAWVATAA